LLAAEAHANAAAASGQSTSSGMMLESGMTSNVNENVFEAVMQAHELANECNSNFICNSLI
jgi:hypothetical protein